MLPILLVTTRSDETLETHLSEIALFNVEVVSDVDGVDARCRDTGRESPAAIVVDLHANMPDPVAPVVRRLRRRFPTVPVVLACTDAARGRDLFQAVRAGAEHIAFLPQDDLARLLGRVVSQARGVLMLEFESTPTADGLPRPARRVFDAIMKFPSAPDSVGVLAEALGISTRTFARRASRYGWPAPGQLLMWGRLVRGASAVTASVEPLALNAFLDASGFPSLDRATRCCARLTGIALSNVLSQGMAAIVPVLLATFGSSLVYDLPMASHTRSTAA